MSVRSPSPARSVAEGARQAVRQVARSTDFPAEAASKDDLKIEAFTGNRAKLGRFLLQLKTVFRLRPQNYPDPKAKVLFASMQLKEGAYEWFEPILKDYLDHASEAEREQDTVNIFSSWVNFEAAIRQVFGTIHEERAAARTVHRIKQTGSAALYYSQFNAVASKLSWNEEAKGSAYYEGLKDVVKDHMIDNIPATYQALVEESIKIDNRLYERRIERGGWVGKNTNSTGYRGKVTHQHYGDPMDLSMVQHGQASRRQGPGRTQGNQRGRGGGNREEYRKKNLCFNCGKSGHRARECNTPAQGLHMVTVGDPTDTAGIEEQKADTSMKTQDISAADKGTAQKEPDMVQGWISQENQDWLTFKDPVQAQTAAEIDDSQRKKNEHMGLSWTGCYDDSCMVHFSDKDGSGWFPKEPKKKRSSRKRQTKNTETLSLSMTDIPDDWEVVQSDQEKEGLKADFGTEIQMDIWAEGVMYASQGIVVVKTLYWEGETDKTRGFSIIAKKWSKWIGFCTCRKQECTYKENIHSHQNNVVVNLLNLSNIIQDTILHGTPYGEGDALVCAMTDIPDQENQQTGEEDLYKNDPVMDEPSSEDDDEAEFHSMSQQGFFFVTNTTRERITMTTLFWNRTKCQNIECIRQPEEHHHFTFDPETIAKEFPKTLVLEVCSDHDCEHQPDIHSHREDNGEVITMEVPPQILKKIWGREVPEPETAQINLMWDQAEGVMVVTQHTDERGNHHMMGAPFWCADPECPEYDEQAHQHLFNVDPLYPRIPIQPRTLNGMVAHGFTCCDAGCEWDKDMHVHFSKNE